MKNSTSQTLRMAIVNAAMADESFREALASDPHEAIKARFGETSLKLRVYFETAGTLPILIPTRSERMEQAIAQVAEGLGDRSPTRGEFEALVIHRAWNDPAFKKRLDDDLRGAVIDLLKKYDADLPEEATVELYVERPGECVVIVPAAVNLEELSDAELEAVSGGESALIVGAIVGGIVGAIASKVVDEVWSSADDSGEVGIDDEMRAT